MSSRGTHRWRSRLRKADAIGVGLYGLRGRTGRSILTAVGITIGIASIVAVLGISASSRADILAQIDRLGTDLLAVQPGSTIFGEEAHLPEEAPSMVRRIGPVDSAASVTRLSTTVHRNTLTNDENGLDVIAVEPELLPTIDGSMATGRFIDVGSSELPTVVLLGAVAAQRLGIDSLVGTPTVAIAGQQFSVIGILDPLPLHPDLDRTVMIGSAAAETYLGAEVIPSRIYVRADPDHVESVRGVLAATANPASPDEVDVSRPSDALEAKAQVDQGLQTLLVGLGTVALAVGGVGVANVMVISVLERRTEIGLRRALGATRRHIGFQFLIESATLTTIGGVLGAVLGSVITLVYARSQGWMVDVPLPIIVGAIGAALLMGALAGLYPAARAASMNPADAVRPVG
jgi:putative ABC transport system permease protein